LRKDDVANKREQLKQFIEAASKDLNDRIG